MKSNRMKQFGLLLILVLVVLSLVLVTGGAAAKQEPEVFPPDSNPYGKSYGEWSVLWWQWAFSLPADEYHPTIAEGHFDCNYAQDGNVWFLAGAPFEWDIGINNVKRHCTEPIPQGKALLFPILNVVCNTFDEDDVSFGSLENCANFVTDNFLFPISAMIDGRKVEDLEIYRVISPEFDFSTVDPPLWYPPGEVYQGVSGGYWLMLPPLPEGNHHIKFEGDLVYPPGNTDWTTRVHYHFTVGD